MSHPPCPCPSCGLGLDVVVGWARLVTDEPTILKYRGAWGIEDQVAVGGAPEVAVRCPRCCTESHVGRDCPLAAA